MTALDTFVRIVNSSRGLSVQERQDLIEHAAEFPVPYRNKVVSLLRKFDAHVVARERILRERLNETLASFERNLVKEGVEDRMREELLRKAKAQCDRFFQAASV